MSLSRPEVLWPHFPTGRLRTRHPPFFKQEKIDYYFFDSWLHSLLLRKHNYLR